MLKVSLRISAAASLFFALAGMAGIVDAAHAGGGSSISKVCGGVTMSIKCNAAGKACSKTTLTISGRDGTTSKPSKPKGLDKYSAVGLACTKATDGTQYFAVQYGEMPRSCEICEWYSVYDLQGEPLTNNDPLTLTDPDMPPAQQTSPNNNEFDALSKKLGLSKPDMQYLH